MNDLTIIQPDDDDIVMDAYAKKDIDLKRIQATVSSFATRLKGSVAHDPGLENLIIEVEKPNKDAAYFALKEYLVKRNSNHVMKSILRSLLDGHKPKYTKVSAVKHRFEFVDDDGPINSYNVILVEL